MSFFASLDTLFPTVGFRSFLTIFFNSANLPLLKVKDKNLLFPVHDEFDKFLLRPMNLPA
jgi:hypothetical protein